MLARSGLHSASPQSCQLFYRTGKDWAYSCTVSATLRRCPVDRAYFTWVTNFQVGRVQSDALPSTSALTLVVTSSTFDPERHAAMLTVIERMLESVPFERSYTSCMWLMAFLQLLVNIYMATGTPVKIAEGFLAIFTTGPALAPHPVHAAP